MSTGIYFIPVGNERMQKLKFTWCRLAASISPFSFNLSLLENLKKVCSTKDITNGMLKTVKKHIKGICRCTIPLSRYQKCFLTCPFDQRLENWAPTTSQQSISITNMIQQNKNVQNQKLPQEKTITIYQGKG